MISSNGGYKERRAAFVWFGGARDIAESLYCRTVEASEYVMG
jgi:hypothetical protein